MVSHRLHGANAHITVSSQHSQSAASSAAVSTDVIWLRKGGGAITKFTTFEFNCQSVGYQS